MINIGRLPFGSAWFWFGTYSVKFGLVNCFTNILLQALSNQNITLPKSTFILKTSSIFQVKRNDTFTFQLCKDCYVNMKLSCKFKKQCRTSDKRFKSFLRLKEISDIDLYTFLKNSDDTLKLVLHTGIPIRNYSSKFQVLKQYFF